MRSEHMVLAVRCNGVIEGASSSSQNFMMCVVVDCGRTGGKKATHRTLVSFPSGLDVCKCSIRTNTRSSVRSPVGVKM